MDFLAERAPTVRERPPPRIVPGEVIYVIACFDRTIIPLPRRHLLRASAIGLGVSTAGCYDETTGASAERATDETPATGTPAEETPTPARTRGPLSFVARVVEQPSEEAPATIRTKLTNTSENEIAVGTGPKLVFRAPDDAFEHGLVLYPETFVGPNATPDEPTDGCWRYTDDEFLVQDLLEWRSVEGGGSIGERHRVYTVGTDRPCLPDGVYPFGEDVFVDDESRVLDLEVSLTVDGGGRVSVAPGANMQ